MNIVQSIKESISNKENSIDIARKIFLSYQTQAFAGREDIEYSIKNAIKNHLKIPFTSIHVAGSNLKKVCLKIINSLPKRQLITDKKDF